MTKFDFKDLKKKPNQNLLKSSPGGPAAQKEEREATIIAKKQKKLIGRPVLPPEEKLSEKITINITKTEYAKLEEKSGENFNVPLPKLVRALLKKHNEI